jgi:hypothetical protein
MGVNYGTESRRARNARCILVSRSCPFLLGLIFASTVLVSCATPESLSDKEELARLSGKGAVIGIHQGLGSIDDPVVNKIRAEFLDDEVLQRKVTQLVQAAVVGARQATSDIHPDQTAASIADAVAGVLDRHLELTTRRILLAAEATAHSTTVRTVHDSVLVAANSFETASPQLSAGTRKVVESSVDGAMMVLAERFDRKTRDMVKEEMLQYVSAISRTAAREAVGGFKQGLAEEFPEFFPHTRFWSDWLLIGLAAMLILLLLLLIVAGVVITQLVRARR